MSAQPQPLMGSVSIIIPTHDRAALLPEAVESALAQTRAAEVIVVDDGSTDTTAEVLARYGDRIRSLRIERAGPSGARNRGAAASRGAYLLFLDSDDAIAPEKTALHVAAHEAHPDWAVVYSGWQCIDRSGNPVRLPKLPDAVEWALGALLTGELAIPTTGVVTIRREWFESVGGFDPEVPLGADLDLLWRIASRGGAFGAIRRALTRYRVHRESLYNAPVTRDEIERRVAILRRFLARNDVPPEARALSGRAVAVSYWSGALRALRDDQRELARQCLGEVLSADASLFDDVETLIEAVVSIALDPVAVRPEKSIDTFFGVLPPVVGSRLGRLRARAHGRYHAAAAFSAQWHGRWQEVRRHIVPALVADPQLLRNRGFLRVVAEAIVPRARRHRIPARPEHA